MGAGEGGGVEKGGCCAEEDGHSGCVCAGVVLDSSSQGDELEGLVGGRCAGEFGRI